MRRRDSAILPFRLAGGFGRLFARWADAALRRELAESKRQQADMAEAIRTLEMKLRAANDREEFLGSVVATMEKRVDALQSLIAKQIASGKM